jgi:serine/threonine protein kinase
MELLKGGSLKSLMEIKSHFNDDEASLICKGLLKAVEHVH